MKHTNSLTYRVLHNYLNQKDVFYPKNPENKFRNLCRKQYLLIVMVLVSCSQQLPTPGSSTQPSLNYSTSASTSFSPLETPLPTSNIPTPTSLFQPANMDLSGLGQVINTMPEIGNHPLPGRRSFENLISPDLKWIANPYPPSNEPQIILTSVSDPQIRVTNKFDSRVGLIQQFFSWSPDSNAIAVTAYPNNSKSAAFSFAQLIIYRFSKDESLLIPYIFDLPQAADYFNSQITWSPDGRELALLTDNKIFILDDQGHLKRTKTLASRDLYKYTFYDMEDASFWTHGDLFYVVWVSDQGKPKSFELRQTNINSPDKYKLILTGDWDLTIFGTNDRYLLVANYINNFEFDLLLVDRSNFQVERKYNFRSEELALIISDTLPGAPNIIFSVEGRADTYHYREDIWVFDWNDIFPQKMDFDQPWVEVIGWRPVVDSFGYFTNADDHCNLWILRP